MTMTDPAAGQWSRAKAAEWSDGLPWLLGFNFLPSTAVNFIEMWRAQTFDAPTIARELGWAAEFGYNALRTNPPFLVWKNDRDGLIARMDQLCGIAAEHGIGVVFCPFDDCGFGGAEPALGPQPAPIPGVHNSRAVASPGRAAVMDPAQWPEFEAYLRDLVRCFGRDARILFWDIYNEPGNRMIFRAEGFDAYDPALEVHSAELMRCSFAWARNEAPSQPLTVGAWMTPAGTDTGGVPFTHAIDRAALDLSDILTFHAYIARAPLERAIDALEAHGRPILCTEWMARPVGSTLPDQLELFRDRKVGCFQWGLVQGRSQTHLPWPEALVRAHGGHADRSIWFHDILHPDGAPYLEDEAALLRRMSPRARLDAG